MSRLVKATAKPARAAQRPAALAALKPARRGLTSRSVPLHVYEDLLGKPFADGARGPASYDCVGLALEIAHRLGKHVPNYVSSEAELHAQLGAGAATLADLPQIARPVPGCIVLLRISPTEHHIAFMVDEFRMVHTLKDTGCVIERINSNLWQRKVIGFYNLDATVGAVKQ